MNARVPASLHLTQEVELPGVSREQAWEWVADTDSLNQASGLPSVDVKVIGNALGNTTSLVTQQGGLLGMTWEEGPFEFIRPATYRVRRKVVKGPLTSIVFGADLIEKPGATVVRFVLEMTPRIAILAPLVRMGGMKQLRAMMSRVHDLAEKHRASQGSMAAVWSPPPSPLGYGAEPLLQERMLRVKRINPRIAALFEKHLREGPDYELLRIRPFELADRWGEPRIETLRVLLHAAHAEILNLSWDILCPHCRVPSFRGSKLEELSSDGNCDACDLSYTADFDAAVEVTFSVHPLIRPVEPVKFCLGAPQKRKGVLFQQVLNPSETRSVSVSLPAGNYVLVRADSEKRLSLQVAGDGGQKIAATIGKNGVTTGESSMTIIGQDVEFVMENKLDGPVRVALALATVSHDAASASIVTTFQDFRDLFSSQVLMPGVQMSRASVTLLFTDLKGSTSLYQKHGDNEMYARVRDHFAVLTGAVSAEGGGVVKTIGDAVMASFTTPAAGVRAAIAMQKAIAKMNAERGTPELTVKVGLHAGPCLVVNANDRLDYFGNTVNQSARIEGQSKGGDVVITEVIAKDPEVAALLQSNDVAVSQFETQLKGLTGNFQLTRIELSPAKAAATGTG